MIQYFFAHFFNKKMRILIIIILILVSVLSIIVANPQTSQSEMYLNMNHYNEEYYEQMLMIIRYILMFSISLILIEHDADFIKPLIAYFNRGKISFYKLIFYLIIISWLIVIIYSIIILIPSLITHYYQFDLKYFNKFLKLIPDYFIITLILLIFVRDNRKPLSFLLLILLIIINFIQEDTNILFFSYLIPLSSSKIFEYELGYHYLTVYIILLIYLYFLVFLNENV
jgi:hypothetical protein